VPRQWLFAFPAAFLSEIREVGLRLTAARRENVITNPLLVASAFQPIDCHLVKAACISIKGRVALARSESIVKCVIEKSTAARKGAR